MQKDKQNKTKSTSIPIPFLMLLHGLILNNRIVPKEMFSEHFLCAWEKEISEDSKSSQVQFHCSLSRQVTCSELS